MILGFSVLAVLVVTVIFVAVTGQRQVARAHRERLESLRESEDRFRALIDTSSDGILLTGRDGKILYASSSNENIAGYGPEQLRGRSCFEFLRREEAEISRKVLAHLVNNHKAVSGEFMARRRDGTWGWFEGVATNMLARGNIGAIVINYRDITTRKRAEVELKKSHEKLRALATRLQSVREGERTRIAREIHDELGQVLTALNLELTGVRNALSNGSGRRLHGPIERIKSLERLVESTVKSVREIAGELRPAVLDNLGLVAAIEWQAGEFQGKTGIVTDTKLFRKKLTFPSEESTAVFRIFQEALTNIARHSRATKAAVRLERNGHHVILTIHDNGKGITEDEMAASGSLGILGMKERAVVFGGDVEIRGDRNDGTTVTVRIPLRKRRG